ncbi:hypothetical protein DFR86_03345 [Acidianus sulfidivorans JP7]|uniref:DUF5751 domain-containing protein n=1 Tax=Acidianus sulfidivorans JP7 TaxID=619593 RepID=A0A2U9IL86_9CREN|nr:DUF5751 family protein [Acidianus sulfidivorans]AWR96684.1 hypothetical protein DFR86_03345 [Acidianus sulfidivorans JP7]
MEQKIIDYNPIVVIVYTKNEELTEVFRKIFRDAKVHGGKKVIAHVISNSEYWDFFANSREALLDNLDLGLEIFTWKPDEINKMLDKINNTEIKGIITYCDDSNKYQVEKIIGSLDNSLKAKILKDNCK